MTRSNAILYRMDSGIPGDVSRKQSSMVEAAAMNVAAQFTAYGVAAKIVSGKVVPFTGAETVADLYGFIVRPYPTQGQDAAALVPALPIAGYGNFLRAGFMTVLNNAGTPAFGGQAYIRVGNAGVGKPIGGIEALAEQSQAMVAGANTGNGVPTGVASTASADIGGYKVTFLTATTYKVVTPAGRRLDDGVTAVVYAPGTSGITFTIPVGGTAFVAGDTFTLTVTRNTLLVPGLTFKSAADAQSNVEIEFNIKGA